MAVSVSRKEPAAPVLTQRSVPPLTVQVAPLVVEMRRELSVTRVAPELMVMVPPPRETTPLEMVTVPSSTFRPAAVCVPVTGTVNVPVASAPAEKIAVSPDVHAPGVPVPSELAFQKELVPQV